MLAGNDKAFTTSAAVAATIVALIASLTLLQPTSRAHADAMSFTVSPLNAELTVLPGSEQTSIITVKNDVAPTSLETYAPTRLKVYAMDWSLDEDGQPTFQAPGMISSSCSSWISVNPSELTLAPGETELVRVTMDVPKDAQGTYHTIVMFESVGSDTTTRSGVAVNGRIGAALYLQVGPQIRRARVTAFEADLKHTSITVQNTGTTQIRLKGTVEFKGADGLTVAHCALPNAVVLPGPDGIRRLAIDVPELPAGVPLTATALIDYGGDVLLGARCDVKSE